VHALAGVSCLSTRHAPAAAPRSGTVPPELGSLSKLQWLALDGNRLSGTLPAFLGTLPALRGAQLEANQFTGPLPAQWCENNATYSVQDNGLICGEWAWLGSGSRQTGRQPAAEQSGIERCANASGRA
jgi:hypothetical protein